MRRKRRSRRFNVVLSFSITLGVLLAAAVLGVFLSPGTSLFTVKHVPATIPTYAGLIGDFAPANTLQVSYNNFTAIRILNASVLQKGTYIQFIQPRWNVSTTSVEERVSVTLTESSPTVDITTLDPSAFAGVSQALTTGAFAQVRVGTNLLYQTIRLANGTISESWVALVPQLKALLICTGTSQAKSAVVSALSAYDGGSQGLIASKAVQRLLYAANGTSGHLGLGIQNFPGVARTGQMTLITVDKAGSLLFVNNFVSFGNSTEASSQMDYFRRIYIGSERFASYDEILLASETQPLSSLQKAIVLVG